MRIINTFIFVLWLGASVTLAQTTATAPTTRPEPPDQPSPRTDAGWQRAHQRNLRNVADGQFDLIFLGDSITAGWGNNRPVWTRYFEAYKPLNLGISGDRTQHVLWRIANGEIENQKPKVFVLMIGTNNTASDKPPAIARGVETIVAELRKVRPEAKILLLGVLPRGQTPDARRAAAREVNALIVKLADGQTVRFLDMWDAFLDDEGNVSKEVFYDYLHLTAKGYEIWGQTMKPLLDEMMK